MEAAPPTYEKATIVDHWALIAHHIPSRDLCSTALVCTRWHSIFVPHIWGNPASHFGIDNDGVYVALTKFKRTLRTARLLVRRLTHTLHLPPAHAEIYNGLHSHWLRDILERLPNLQSLIVRGLPCFDHSALWALKYLPPEEADQGDGGGEEGVFELPASSGRAFQPRRDVVPSFGLRLLDASRCSNVTSSSLAQALGRFEALLYLDLSFTYPARDAGVLNMLRRFTGLQVLKLRGISLNDDSLNILAPSIGRRVRSLDIRDNHITDRGIRTLLEHCFISSNSEDGPMPSGRRSPSLIPYMGAEMLGIYQGEDFESFLRQTFTRMFIGRLAFEDAPEGGITHLYLTGNSLTVEGISGLVRSGRLHVLDVDSTVDEISTSSRGRRNSSMRVPGVEKLTPVLAEHGGSLTFLRINHSLVTKDPPDPHPDHTIPGRAELDDTALPDLPKYAAELDSKSIQPERFELPTTTTPRAELVGDPVQLIVSPAHTNGTTQPPEEPVYSGPRRGSAFAPEAIDTLNTQTEQLHLLSPVSTSGEGTLPFSFNQAPPSPLSPLSPISASPNQPNYFPLPRPRTYSSLLNSRTARLNSHRATKANLHPAMLPYLRTLILTSVPPTTPTSDLTTRLKTFLTHCATESHHANAEARLDYSLPPNQRNHCAALKRAADQIFALKRVVLELESPTYADGRRGSKASPWQHSSTKSMTEDQDSESLWSAAETDFSFFGAEGEEDYPSLQMGRFAGCGSLEKEVSFLRPGSGRFQEVKQKKQEIFDTVAVISAWRRERKAAHERAVVAARAAGCGSGEVETEGYWEGVVQVVRQSGAGLRGGEEVDYYGNRFCNGYLYR